MKPIAICTLLVLGSLQAFPQGGYVVNRVVDFPDTSLVADATPLAVSPNREDVRAIGMGRAQVSNGKTFNAMMYNPALLARGKTTFDVAGLQVGLPPRTFDALEFLRDNAGEFRTGGFLTSMNQGIRDLRTATTIEAQLAALQKIQSGIRFANSMQDALGGASGDPVLHGVTVIPQVQAQVGNFGFALYGEAQSGFELLPGAVVPRLAKLQIPDRLDDITPDLLLALVEVIDPLLDDNGELREGSLPEVHAVSVLDIVGAVGYGKTVSRSLSLGVNLKVVNRRFSTKRIAADYFSSILRELNRDFEHSVTGFTMDVGALYTLPSGKTQVGVSVQNIIPLKTIQSSASARVSVTGIIDYDRDNNGNVILVGGDTALVGAQRQVTVSVPFDLTSPVVANIGVTHALSPAWDVSFDWTDVAAQDDRFEEYMQRFRLGTEYRIDFVPDRFGLAVRGGLADKRPTVGLGLNLYRVVQIDGAYAYDALVADYSYYAQIRIGW